MTLFYLFDMNKIFIIHDYILNLLMCVYSSN